MYHMHLVKYLVQKNKKNLSHNYKQNLINIQMCGEKIKQEYFNSYNTMQIQEHQKVVWL